MTTQVSFTSGELMNIISTLEDKINNLEDPMLGAYYGNIMSQFEMVLDKVKEKQPEKRVGTLILAA